MLQLLFSAKDRARNRKRGNHAGDKSRMHLQESLRENSVGRGYKAQTATQLLQSKSQQTLSHATSGRHTFEGTGE